MGLCGEQRGSHDTYASVVGKGLRDYTWWACISVGKYFLDNITQKPGESYRSVGTQPQQE